MGAAEDFDEIASEWNEFKREPLEAARLLAGLAEKGERALLIGCGNARNARLLKKFDFIEGVDASPRMVEFAKANGLKAITADARNLPFDDASFNAVFCFAVLHHFDPEGLNKVLQEARRVLKGNGRAYATLWFKKNKSGYCPIAWKKKDGSIMKRSYWFYSLDELQKIAESNCFKIIDSFYEASGERSNKGNATNTCLILEKED
jgi:SAM-dependent methyltransferase